MMDKLPIFIDLEKAFDTVTHDTVLEKIDSYGIRSISNDWFRSCLSDRSQLVSINGDYKLENDYNCDYS